MSLVKEALVLVADRVRAARPRLSAERASVRARTSAEVVATHLIQDRP